MSLSIDYITMPPKSQEVSQIQHGDQVRYEHSQQEVASQVQQQVHQNSHQTIRRAKAEDKDYLNEEEKRRGKKGSGGKGRTSFGETSAGDGKGSESRWKLF